jgi:predicted ATPase/DNA-binding winged helix-turn-helix (wHTH) protein
MHMDYRFGNAELRPDQRLLLVGGKQSHIGARAFDLLLALVERRDRVVAKDELLDSVWPGIVVEENNLQVHISNLRKVLGPRAIVTVPGRGYQFTAPVESAGGQANLDAPPSPASAVAELLQTNLPAELPPLVARDDEIGQLAALLRAHRVVTVVGPGGIGKTVLAQAAARQALAHFREGVWLVDLAPLADGSLVVSAVASALHLVLRADSQPQTLAKALASTQRLLVLDNCEHVAGAVAELVQALSQGAPRVCFLATSQERLKLAHEQVFRLGALSLPTAPGVEAARRSGAVSLFERRAAAADAAFRIDADNAAAVAEICRHLDGIPLAIELAAARVPLLGVSALHARLDERFRLLGSGSRVGPARHRTLRAALEWSHGLLSPQEQLLFRRLGIFAGSFDLDSAHCVAAEAGIEDAAVFDLLAGLVEKSLVVAEPQELPRYRMLETTRVFALEKLREAREWEAASRSLALAMVATFMRSRHDEYRMARQDCVQRYLPDLDNARAALDWCAGPSGDADLHVALAGAMAWLWVEAGLRGEGQHRTAPVIARIGGNTPPRAQALLLTSWTRLAFPDIGERERACGQRAVALYRDLGDERGLFIALAEQGRGLSMFGEPGPAAQLIAQAQALLHAEWPPAIRCPLLQARYWVAHTGGDYHESIRICDELRQLARQLGDRRMALNALIAQEQAYAGLGEMAEAVVRGRQLVQMLEEQPAAAGCLEGYIYGNLVISLCETGNVGEALEMARKAYSFREQAGGTLCILDPFARLAFLRGHVRDAAQILGRAEMRYATSNEKRQPVERQIREKLLAQLEAALPAEELQRLMREGSALTDEAAAQLALGDGAA